MTRASLTTPATKQSADPLHAAAVTQACRLIDAAINNAAVMPSLDQLAIQVGISRFHFHRLFKNFTGITPKAYAAAQRAAYLREQLPHSKSVSEAIYAAGFNSAAPFYAQAEQLLGMPVKKYRRGGEQEIIRFAVGDCSLGAILVAATAKGICAILLADEAELLLRELHERFPAAQLIGADKKFEQWVATVIGFVEAPQLGLDLPLDIRGSAFQQRVWQALRDIPFGKTVSYSDIAEKIGAPKSVRAVASACAANAIAIAIPCHRVVRINGDLSGYRWGIARKRELLAREKEIDVVGAGHARD